MRYITPETLLRMRFGEPPWPHWDIAVLCFRGDAGGGALADKLNARPVGAKTLYALASNGFSSCSAVSGAARKRRSSSKSWPASAYA